MVFGFIMVLVKDIYINNECHDSLQCDSSNRTIVENDTKNLCFDDDGKSPLSNNKNYNWGIINFDKNFNNKLTILIIYLSNKSSYLFYKYSYLSCNFQYIFLVIDQNIFNSSGSF